MDFTLFGRNYTIGFTNIKRRLYGVLAKIWFIPFGFYDAPLRVSKKTPHPLNPRDFRDLMLNRMIFPDNILRAVVADKLAARGWVSEKIGPGYLAPLLDVCDSPQQLRDDYPLPYVIKSNHASAQVKMVNHPDDLAGFQKTAAGWLSREYNPVFEWVYRDIEPKLLVEKMLLDTAGKPVSDIKIYYFFGTPVFLIFIEGRFEEMNVNFLSPEWEVLGIHQILEPIRPPSEKPENFDEILRLGAILAADFDYIRVDMYISEGRIYFGELTSFPTAATYLHEPPDWDVFLLEEYERLKKDNIDSRRAHFSQTILNNIAGNSAG